MNKIVTQSSWFLDQLTVFQAANSDYQSIKDNFIIRKAEFSIIIDSILNKKSKDPLQHELILGRRGSGKSTLLKRIEVEVSENDKLSKKYITINLAEEQAGIYRLFDLWEQVLEELKHQTTVEIHLEDYTSFKDNQEYTRYLYSVIHDVCAKSKKKIILLLDNFDRIVENFNDDGSLLRETLINFNDIQLIAGSTRMDEHFWRYDMPFYEFFRRHRLEALTRDEVDILLNHWSNVLNIPELKEFIKSNPGKIENIRLLTDGLPRTLQFFIQIVLQKSETGTYEYLRKTMDNASPLFQERLNSLPAQLRKIVLEMAFIWEACTTKQLVEKARMESKLISANLNTLVDRGIVEKIETNKKQHLYRLSERFFNMWLIVTQGNPEQKRKAKWLSVFLENWYDANDLKRIAGEHISKLKNGETDWNHALVFSKALCQSKYISLEERDAIIELTERAKPTDISNCLLEMPEKYSSLFSKIEKVIDEGNYDKAIELANGIENEVDGVKFILLGAIYLMLVNYRKAEEYFKFALDKKNSDALFYLALTFDHKKEFENAEKLYESASKQGDLRAANNLAMLYASQAKYSEAENWFLLAINQGDSKASNNLANLYKDQTKYSEAEKYYLLAIERGNPDALFNLALLYDDLGKYSEAEKYYLLAIKRGYAMASFNLAILCKAQKRFDQAEKYYLEAINQGETKALYNIGSLYYEQGNYIKAEQYYSQAIELGILDGLNNLGNVYDAQGEFDKAEKYYLQAIDHEDKYALYNLALLYHSREKYSEAEKYYKLAIRKGINQATNNLAYLYYQINKYKKEALNHLVTNYQQVDDLEFQESRIILELWSGIFNDVANRVISIIKRREGEALETFVTELLIQQQKNLVLRLFQDEEIGAMLREKYLVLYYVTLLLTHPDDENLKLRIPPELQSTIDEVLVKIEERQKFYGYK